MKFGIIGAGRIGKIHGGNVAARPDSQVAFVADADPAAAAALAKATGAKVAEIDAILASKDVDAVAICSPTDTNADLIERRRSRQKPFLREADPSHVTESAPASSRHKPGDAVVGQSPLRLNFRFARARRRDRRS